MQALLDVLIERGLDSKVCRLLIVDGDKALSKGMKAIGPRVLCLARWSPHHSKRGNEIVADLIARDTSVMQISQSSVPR